MGQTLILIKSDTITTSAELLAKNGWVVLCKNHFKDIAINSGADNIPLFCQKLCEEAAQTALEHDHDVVVTSDFEGFHEIEHYCSIRNFLNVEGIGLNITFPFDNPINRVRMRMQTYKLLSELKQIEEYYSGN